MINPGLEALKVFPHRLNASIMTYLVRGGAATQPCGAALDPDTPKFALMASQALVRVSVTELRPTPVWTRLTMFLWNLETETRPEVSHEVRALLVRLTSSYGEISDFIVQVVTVHIEDNADVEDEEGHQQVGDV